MRVFTVHLDPLSVADDDGAVLIREGFSWPAALFSVLWTLYHRLWGWSLVVFAVGAGLSAVAPLLGFGLAGQTALQIGFAVIVGYSANDWRRRAYERRGFRLIAIVAADDLGRAEQRFFSSHHTPSFS